jgi:hypothetical protein
MKAASNLTNIGCQLMQAHRYMENGNRIVTITYLNRASNAADAAGMAKKSMIKTKINSAIEVIKNRDAKVYDLLPAIEDAAAAVLLTKRTTFRKCGAKVDF